MSSSSSTRRSFLQTGTLALSAVSSLSARTAPPKPYGALPSERQVRWSEMEFYNFLHFTINTFTDKEWGYGDEDPKLFDPTSFDADSIVGTLKEAGSKGVILTAKHHDGFCLWPTKTTERSIKQSPYKGGRGDIVKEIGEAAHKHGLRYGLYLSPWDRSQKTYGTPEYIKVYRAQARELLTNYGELFEIWHDGANGGDGFYGGAREKRKIDKRSYYDWSNTWQLERKLQPNAVLFSDIGPDVRWVGNEKGIAGETCWATYSPVAPNGGAASPGDVREKESTVGTRNGKHWMPAECDVSIRPGWFWHEKENSKVRTPRQLMDLYYNSVGRGASFLLNIPPDRRGLIHEIDAKSLREFGRVTRSTFAKNLAAGANVTASNTRGSEATYHARNLVDGKRNTYWATNDDVTTAEVTLTLPQTAKFDIVRLRENIRLGQRIDEFAVDAWQGNEWTEIGKATSVGICRLVKLKEPVTASRVRLRITKAAACPALSELGFYLEAPIES